MGHQVNFYALPTELSSLEESWRTKGPMTVLHSRSPKPEPRVLASPDFEEDGQRWLFFYLVRSADLESVVMRHVPAQGYWSIDETSSPVVELTLGFFDEQILRRGRLHFVDGHYGSAGEWIEKPADFKAWGLSLLSVTKKALERHKTDYIGPEARNWLESTKGRLVVL